MMFVVAMFLIVASFAIPAYSNISLRAREATLRDDLFPMRALIGRIVPLQPHYSQPLLGPLKVPGEPLFL